MNESKIFTDTNINIPIQGGYDNIILLTERRTTKLYRATKLGKHYIIKTTKDNDERQLTMLRREYELSIECTHPHIVHIYSYENIPLLGEAIVMEYVEGRTLNHYLAEKPTKQSLNQIFEELLSALSYLHKRGIVHNDIKPENIIISRTDNTLKLIDFGLADNDAQYAIRQLGCTPAYASPELLSQHNVIDARSDIYSVGAVMRQIFGSKHKNIIAKCIKQNPEERYPDITTLQTAWQNRNRKRTILLYITVAIIVLLSSVLLINKIIEEKNWEEEKATAIIQIEAELNEFYQVALDSIQNHAHFKEFALNTVQSYWNKVEYQRKHKIYTITNEELRTILDILPLKTELGYKLVEESNKLPTMGETPMNEDERQYYLQLFVDKKPYKPYNK